VSPVLPSGDPAPADGRLPDSVTEGAGERAFGVYLHVPYCSVRCGYCDFNTYAVGEMSADAGPGSYLAGAHRELELAGSVLDAAGLPARPAATVFVGGGTPTLLPTAELAALLGHVRDRFGLAPDAEVTTEANPDSVDAAALEQLSAAGFTRVSFGMQSAVPSVLATLDRTHDPRRMSAVVGWARAAGFQVSVDLIYGTPGETAEHWRASLDAAVALEPDHLSAYALTVEPGTRLHRLVRRGEVADVDADRQADAYEVADPVLAAAGLHWYEISNFSTTQRTRARHNLGYWRMDDWWGIGPGAHSHVGGVRWWNVKHPHAYADRLDAGESPAAAREVLDAHARQTERVMLAVRLADGVAVDSLPDLGSDAEPVSGLVADGLLEPLGTGRFRLTLRGRMLADLVVRRLLGW